MPRRAQGPRLYLRKGRLDRRTGRALPDVWVIRDGAVEISTGCDADRLRGSHGAEGRLERYLAEKFAQTAPARPVGDRRRDPAYVLVAEVLAAYAAERAPALAADKATIAAWIRYLLAWWGDRTLADVKRSTCQAYVAHRTAQLNPRFTRHPERATRISTATAARELDELSAAIAWWHGEDTLTTRPKVWTPEPQESPRDALTRSQAARLLRASLAHGLGASARANRAHLRRFILIALYTGTRHAVIRQLLWSESPSQAWVDLDAGMIYRRGRRERERANKRRPVVKIPPRLLAHLRRWRRLDIEDASRRDETARLAGAEPRPQTNAVVHHGGHPLAGHIRRSFASAVAAAGLPPAITPHWLRHTAATWLMERNVDPWQAAGYLGMTIATLERHYGHHRPTHQAEAAGAWGARG